MADVSRPRDQSTFAVRSWKSAIFRWIMQRAPAATGLKLGPISDHIARDIGLSDAEIERHRPRLPSQTDDRSRG